MVSGLIAVRRSSSCDAATPQVCVERHMAESSSAHVVARGLCGRSILL
jgi:hypothetical protein